MVPAAADLTALSSSMERELRENILPFWMKYMVDHQKGGFYGALTNDLQVRDGVERSLVLCARMLWTYSAAYRVWPEPSYLATAQHAWAYLREKFLDPAYGGMYWWLDCDGQPVNDRKQTYGQAFAIYGLSEFFRASRETSALDMARVLFEAVEQHAYDPIYQGYIEGCARDWSALSDMRLSKKEPFNAPKSMNTLLHVLEAYANLLTVWPDPCLKQSLRKLLEVYLARVIDPDTHFTRLFFEQDWTSLSDQISFGHDIETSWLLVEAAQHLGDPALIARTRGVAAAMAGAVYTRGLQQDGSLVHESTPRGIINRERHWWCQAEGVVGFINAYQITGDTGYLQAALRLWNFIRTHMIDHQHGEWYKVLDPDLIPLPGQVKAGPWEDPYHQSRACLEIIRRTSD